jgi:hypothetical protein
MDQQHAPDGSRERLEAHTRRVAGSQLLLLEDIPAAVRNLLLDLLGSIAHDDRRAGKAGAVQRAQNADQHGLAGQQVKDFGQAGPHSGSLAGSEDHGRRVIAGDRGTLG